MQPPTSHRRPFGDQQRRGIRQGWHDGRHCWLKHIPKLPEDENVSSIRRREDGRISQVTESNLDRFFKLAPYRGCIMIVNDAGWPGIIVYTTKMIGRRRRSFCCRCHCWVGRRFLRRNSNKRFGKPKALSLETTMACNDRRNRCIWTLIIIWICISTQNYT